MKAKTELETILLSGHTVFSLCPPEVKGLINSIPSINKLNKKESQLLSEKYYNNWINWINCSNKLSFQGCETKKYWAITNGIHDALTNQVLYNSGKDFYTFKGDYRFYDILLKNESHHKIFLNEVNKIPENSYVIISIPNHCGFIPTEFRKLITHSLKNNIKIFLDCAFYGTILSGIVDTSLPCFETVAFSLSKPFLMGGCRTGIVFSDNLAPPLNEIMQSYYNYWNSNGVRILNDVMENFSADYMPKKYKKSQEKICKKYKLDACDIFMLARSNDSKYINYRRNNLEYARFCITDLLEVYRNG